MSIVSRRVALLVSGTLFMEILDGTIISTAAPDIGRSLHVRAADVGVVITAYAVAVAVLIPVSGWLANRLGTRSVFLTAIATFTVASGLCALSRSLPVLVAFRVLQGAGGALMVPVGRLVVLRDTAKRDLIRAIAFLTWPALTAPVVAPLAGGLITTYLSWPWIFLINVPLGVAALPFAAATIPQLRSPAAQLIDLSGFAQTAGGLACLVLAISALGSTPTSWTFAGGAGLAAALLLATSTRHLLRAAHPLLELDLLAIRTFRLPHFSGGTFRATVFAVPFVLPLMLQDAFGWTPVTAGALVMSVFAGNLSIKPATTYLLNRWGFRSVITGSVSVVSLTMVGCAGLTASTPLAVMVVLLVISGAARSVGFTAYGTLTFADVDQQRMTAANTLSATLQQLAGGLGVAVGALALQLGTGLTGQPATAVLPYRLTFITLALLTSTCLVEARRAGADAGDHLRTPTRSPRPARPTR